MFLVLSCLLAAVLPLLACWDRLLSWVERSPWISRTMMRTDAVTTESVVIEMTEDLAADGKRTEEADTVRTIEDPEENPGGAEMTIGGARTGQRM